MRIGDAGEVKKYLEISRRGIDGGLVVLVKGCKC